MAAEGSHQQRNLLRVDVDREQLSIDRELNRLNKERNALKEDGRGIDKRILDDLEKQFSQIEKIGKLQISLQEQILFLQHEHEFTGDLDRKAEIEGLLDENRVLQHIFQVERDMAQMRYDDVKERHAVEKEILKTTREQLEKTQDYLGKFNDIFKVQKKYYGVLRDSVGLMGETLLLAAGLAAILETAMGVFKQMDEGLAKFRINMGMSRINAKRLSEVIKTVATEFTSVGVTIEGAAESIKALANEFGGTVKISKDLVETTALLKAQLGVSEDVSAGFLRNISALSKSTAQTQRHMAFVAQRLTAAAGVPLNLVMQDVAKMSGTTLAMVSRIPLEILKSATAARQLGSSLNKMSDSSRQILNFTESVQAEMEASVLIGSAINLQLARELAYRRDIIGSTKAILAEARRVNFENLDVFQMEAFATATGRSTDEILKMIQAQKQMDAARNIDELKDEIALIDRLAAMRESDILNEGLQVELSVKRMANQERLVALQNTWNQLLMEVTRVLFPIIDGFLKVGIVLVKLLPSLSMITVGFTTIGSIISKIGVSVGKLNGILYGVGLSVFKLSKPFTFVGTLFSSLASVIGNSLGSLKNFIPSLSILSKFKFVLPFLKVVPVIGWLISGIQFIYNLLERIGKIEADGWVDGFIQGIKAIGGAAFDTLIQPFFDVAKYIKYWFEGHSPSRIGQVIIDGLVGSGAAMLDALILPFKGFLSWIGSFSLTNVFKSLASGLISPFKALFSFDVGQVATPVDGIISILKSSFTGIQPIIFDSLMAPFQKFIDWITTKFPDTMGIVSNQLKASLASITFDPIILEKRLLGVETKPVEVHSENIPIVQSNVSKPVSSLTEERQKDDADSTTLVEILKSLNVLNANLMAGKIAVNIDGQLISATLARQTAFKGGYGTNNVNIL
jgi:regulator of replication initiation timing